MPVFRVDIVYRTGKRHREFRIVDDVDLDIYYSYIQRFALNRLHVIAGFDVVQISEHSAVAKLMRTNKMKQMTPAMPAAQYRRRGR